MITPRYFEWDHDGPADRFQVRLLQDGTPIHGVQVNVGDPTLVQVGNHFKLDAGAQGFSPNGSTIPSHTDLVFTVIAANGPDVSGVATSSPFQFHDAIPTPTNLSVS